MQYQNSPARARSRSLILQYPTLPLNDTIASYIAEPTVPTMTGTSANDRPPSSLSDSWALLSSSESASEDDARSELTDLASVAGTNGPDDISSIDDQETSSEADAREPTDAGSDSEDMATFPPSTTQSVGDMGYSSNATICGGYPSAFEGIEFEEPKRWPDAEEVELKHTIRIFSDEEASEIMSPIPSESRTQNLVATVRQSMVKESLQLQQPFRVLYAGNPNFRSVFIEKIGLALVTGRDANLDTLPGDSSRYHVFPGSFGSPDTPNTAELLRIPDHAQLVVDECTSASLVKIEKQSDMITLSFKNRPACHSRLVSPNSSYELESATPWELPDIAIIFMSEEDGLITKRTRRYVQAFAKRHGIPVTVVSERPLWGEEVEYLPLNHQSAHLCLESRGSVDRESRVLKRLPIDLKTFESIAPGQMNRNLACLTGLYAGKEPDRVASFEPELPENADVEKAPRIAFGFVEGIESFRKRRRPDISSLLPLGLVVFILVLYPIAQIGLPHLVHELFSHPQEMDVTSQISGLPTSTAAVTTTSVQSNAGQPIASVPPNAISSIDPKMDLAQFLLDPKARQVNHSDLFEVHVLGDCHIVLRPPRQILTVKKTPKFTVQVSRNNQTLKHDLLKLFDGVYTIRLGREDAHGPVNVSIRTRTKPVISLVAEVDFGTPWLKLSGWKKAAQIASLQLRKDLQTAQSFIGVAYERLRHDLEIAAQHLSEEASIRWKEAQTESKKVASEQAGIILAKSKELSSLAAERGEVASKLLGVQVKVLSKLLSRRGFALSRELGLYTGESWRYVVEQTAKLREEASKVKLEDIRDKVRSQSRSSVLAKAQQQAHQLLRRPRTQSHLKKVCNNKQQKKGDCKYDST